MHGARKEGKDARLPLQAVLLCNRLAAVQTLAAHTRSTARLELLELLEISYGLLEARGRCAEKL